MKRKIIITGAFLGFSAVVLGAFGAHGLKNILDADQISSFRTGVDYQIYHAFFLFAIVFLSNHISLKAIKAIYILVLIGVILFSGSIYFFSLNSALHWLELPKLFYLITPIGGTCLITAWGLLMYTTYKKFIN